MAVRGLTQAQRDEKAAEKCYELFARALSGHMAINRLKNKDLAEIYDICTVTVSKLRDMEDVSVPIKTVFKMMKAMGIEMELSEKITKA